jgi:hypothetical protein
VARTRTTKKLAQRIDLNYFKRPTPLKRAKIWLSLLLPLLALLWIAERTFFKDSRVYSSGRLSEPHAILEKECSVCHFRKDGQFSAKVSDSACLACHDGPEHHATQTPAPTCATCHAEHRGRINLFAVSNLSCASCHSHLRAYGDAAHYVLSIRSFEDGHPNFDAADKTNRDPGTIKLNHSLHMKPIRPAPGGPNVQMDCSDCHRTAVAAAKSMWTYADAKYSAASISYTDADNFRAAGTSGLAPHNPSTGRELMEPVKFANACAGCHLLTFDRRFDSGVPHDKPDVIHAFVVKKFTEYIAAHPGELHEMQDPQRNLTGRPPAPRTRAVTPSQWVTEKTAVAEELLWHKTCTQCHQMSASALRDTRIARWSVSNPNGTNRTSSSSLAEAPPDQDDRFTIRETNLPAVAPANITLRWMPHAKFDHGAHEGFTCVSCHAKALTSTESSDILLPGIETCKTCHAPGPEHAESRCFECHTYHDWSKRKEVTPKFTLPALQTGGR